MATTIRNGNLFCLNCGQEFKIQYPCATEDFNKKAKAFEVLHNDCPKKWEEPEADQSKSIEEKAWFWWNNGERGCSSEAIWQCCMGHCGRRDYPYDPDDFSRCYKLFKAVPEWRTGHYIKLISQMSPQWAKLMENWDKLTEMFEENQRTGWKNYKKIGMYELMQTCIGRV
jgi:hypothetical protein